MSEVIAKHPPHSNINGDAEGRSVIGKKETFSYLEMERIMV